MGKARGKGADASGKKKKGKAAAGKQKLPPSLLKPWDIVPLTNCNLSEAVIEDFCGLTASGWSASTICNFLGIGGTAFHAWVRKGVEYIETLESGGDPNPKHKLYGIFVRNFKKAHAMYLGILTNKLHAKVDQQRTWIRNLAVLERRDRTTYGKNTPPGGDAAQYEPDERYL